MSFTDSGGSYNYGGKINFLYASRYNGSNRTYYHRFANTGQYLFCVTSEGFAHLMGDVQIRLLPGETKYLVLKNVYQSNVYNYRLHFYESCGWFSYSGGSIELTMPVK